MQGVMNGTLRPSKPKDCDPAWSSIMEKCWATQPSKRATFTDVADALDALVAKCDADASTRFVACKCVSVHVLRLLLHMAMYLSHLHKEYM